MPRFNGLQIFLSFLAVATFGLTLGLMIADVPSITLRITLPIIFLVELVVLALTFLPQKKNVVRRSASITTAHAPKVVKRAQPQRNLGTKPDNAMWKWIKENLSKAFLYTKPRAATAMCTTKHATQEMWNTFKAETKQGRADFMERVKSSFSSAWDTAWAYIRAILADLFGKLFKLITGGYGAWAALLFWSITTLMLNYVLFFGGHVLDEDEAGLARGLSLVFVILMLLFFAAARKPLDKLIDKWF